MSSAQYEPGQVLPGTVYRVVRHLATGGMGTVYDVEDVTVEKRYVLKTLHPSLVSREDLALRMRDEARSLAKLSHPNIVDVVTAGITSDAQKVPFYVMERLIGQNLRVVLGKTGPLHVLHAYRIAIDVADALEHAHENNIVHRDVKPENIFLHRNANGTTTTKLLDFGIVRLLDRKANPTQGKFIGTLKYASPEQIAGKTIGPASDIYSLGLVLYEMLSGRGPFDDAGDAYAIGTAHTNDEAPPLSRFMQVAPDVERLVASALAKDPRARPRDCFTFASELRRVLRDEEANPRASTAANVMVSSPPPTPPAVSGTRPPLDATQQGMIPPSAVASVAPPALTAAPETRDERDAPVSPVAPTLAADEEAGRGGSLPPTVGRPGDRQGPIDRSAPTRASVPAGVKQPIAQNGTWMDAGHQTGQTAYGNSIVNAPGPQTTYPPVRASIPTGPIAGEALTRPPERGHWVLLLASAVISVTLIGGAVMFAKKRRPAATPAVPTAVVSTEAPPVVTSTAAPVEKASPVAPPPVTAEVQAATPPQQEAPHRGRAEPSPVRAPAPPTPLATKPTSAASAARQPKPAAEPKPKAPAAGGPTAPAVPFDP